MFKLSISALLLFIFMTLTGCDKFQSSPDTVILDLDAIAKATGQADIIKQQIDNANRDLNSQLNDISNALNEELAAEKKKIGNKPSKSEKQNLQQLTQQANQKMQQAKSLASQKSQQYQAALIQQLRQQVSPIAENIARQRGANVVLTANNSLMWFNPVVDITDEIIAEMRAQPTAKKTEESTATENTDVVTE